MQGYVVIEKRDVGVARWVDMPPANIMHELQMKGWGGGHKVEMWVLRSAPSPNFKWNSPKKKKLRKSHWRRSPMPVKNAVIKRSQTCEERGSKD